MAGQENSENRAIGGIYRGKMGLSSQDFVVAFRALSSRACPASALRRALKTQAGRMEKGRRLTLFETLLEERLIAPDRAGELNSAAPVDLRGDPEALAEAAELFMAAEAASEIELDRIVDSLTRPPDARTLPAVPVPSPIPGYDLSWEIGRSRGGAVFRGSRPGAPGAVAVKIFRREAFPSDEARRGFIERVTSTPPPVHTSFVPALAALEAGGQAVVVMDFVDGASLASLLAERKMSMRRGFEIVARAAEGLAAAHAEGRAHGALSAGSILVERNDRPRIVEFGWKAGGAPADDVAALGAVLYEIACGTPPFGGLRSKKLKPPSVHNPSAAGAAERVILKALARDPARRYPNAGALAADLARFLRHEEVEADVRPEEASPPSRVVAARRASPKVKIAVAAAAVALVAAGVVVAVLSSGGGSQPAPAAPAPVTLAPPSAPPAAPPPRPAPPVPKTDARVKELAAKGPLKPYEEIEFQFRATALLTKRAFDELDQLADEALIRGPESDWAHYYRAFVAFERDDDENALKHADRALALGMNRAALFELRFDIRLSRAEYRLSLEELGRLYPKEAVSLANQEILRLSRELEKDPRNGDALVRRGALFLYRHLSARAVEDFTKAAAGGESRADYFLAMALKEEDRLAEAAGAVKRFLAAHGGLPGAAEAKTFLETLPQ
jgi:tetratricopeptide (TPR) repeat protein